MKISNILVVFLLFILQANLSPNEEIFNFIIVIIGISVLIIILVYILLTSKEED